MDAIRYPVHRYKSSKDSIRVTIDDIPSVSPRRRDTYNHPLEQTASSSFLRENSTHKPISKLADSTMSCDSRAVAGYIKSLQSKVSRLEDENQSLRTTVATLEAKAETDRENWKSRLMDEVNTSKDRELELLEKFKRLDSKLKSEAKRMNAAETAFKDAAADLSVKLERANAANEALTARLEKAESDYTDLVNAKVALERRCAAFETELQLSRLQPTSASQQVALHPADMSLITIEDISQPAPRTGKPHSLMDEIRKEITDARESADLPRSHSDHESCIGRYLHETPLQAPSDYSVKRCSSLKTLTKEKLTHTTKNRRNTAEGSLRLLSLPSSPIVFNPNRENRSGGLKICVKLSAKPGRAPVKTQY